MENKEGIALDLDGVLYPWHEAVCMYYKLYKNYTGTEYNFMKNSDKYMTCEDWNYIVTIPDLYYKYTPSSRLMKLLFNLSEKFNIFYITSRPEEMRRVTAKYLRDFKFPQKDNVIFSKENDIYARLLKLSFFVEDNVSNAEKLSRVCTTFLVRTPFNEDYTGNVPMLNSIYDLERILL